MDSAVLHHCNCICREGLSEPEVRESLNGELLKKNHLGLKYRWLQTEVFSHFVFYWITGHLLDLSHSLKKIQYSNVLFTESLMDHDVQS